MKNLVCGLVLGDIGLETSINMERNRTTKTSQDLQLLEMEVAGESKKGSTLCLATG